MQTRINGRIRYTRFHAWGGTVVEEECTQHTWGWSGRTPNTGEERCLHCGALRTEVESMDDGPVTVFDDSEEEAQQ
jgi:hypothetical protein